MLGDYFPSCQINLSKCGKVFSNIRGGTGICTSCALFLAIIQTGISQLLKEHSLRRPQYMHYVAKGDFPCFVYWSMKVGKLRLWINWHCIHTLGPSKKMKNSSLSWSTCQWITPKSVSQCITKVGRKDPPRGHSVWSPWISLIDLLNCHAIQMNLGPNTLQWVL